MTIIAGTTVAWRLSPRIITIPAPTTEVTVTDLHETMLDLEAGVEGMAHEHLRETSGGEALGGGVKVGVTSELQNAQIAFEARVTPLESGTITTPGTTTLTDSTATFVTNSVGRGDLVYNTTDGSQATVVSVDSETQLTTTTLVGGTDNDYDSADAYVVYDVVQCRVTGGNLVAVDDVGGEISPIFPTFGTQILTTASSSATTQELQDIQFSSFVGGVWVDLVSGTSGTTFPTGTERQPCGNFTDALSIADTRGFNDFYVITDATIDSGLDYTGYVFVGRGKNLTTFTLDPAATLTNCTFTQAAISGTLDGEARLDDCIIQGLTFVSGVIENCILDPGTITLGGSAEAHFINCASGVPGASTPVIDMGGSGQALGLRNYNGGIRLQNKTGTDAVSIDLNSGQVILDSATVTGTGPIIVRGVGKLIDENGAAIGTGTWNGSVPVTNELVEGMNIKQLWQDRGFDASNPVTVNETAGTISVAGTIRTWAGSVIKTLTRTT